MSARLNFRPSLLLQQRRDQFPIDISILGRGSERNGIYGLRYRAFRAAGLIAEREDEKFADAYDDLETTVTLAATDAGQSVGTFRLTFADTTTGMDSLPCRTIFPQVGRLGGQGFQRAVEFTRLVVAPDLVNTSYRTTLYATLVRAGLIVAHAARADYGLISINPSQVRFYEMMCAFKEIARADGYPGIDAPAVLLGRDFRALDRKRSRQNAFFKISDVEVADARRLIFGPQGSAPTAGAAEAMA